MFDDDRSIRTDASAQTIIDCMKDETSRRRRKLKSRRDVVGCEVGGKLQRGIMSVRTQSESIRSIKTPTFKQRRRDMKKILADSLGNSTLSTSGSSGFGCFVSYSSVSLRKYETIPGNNPAVSRGVPVTIGWEHHSEVTLDIEEYEDEKHEYKHATRMSPDARSQILLNQGHTWEAIHTAIQESNIARRQRIRTIEKMTADRKTNKFDKGIEEIKQVFRNTFAPNPKPIKLNLSSDLSLGPEATERSKFNDLNKYKRKPLEKGRDTIGLQTECHTQLEQGSLSPEDSEMFTPIMPEIPTTVASAESSDIDDHKKPSSDCAESPLRHGLLDESQHKRRSHRVRWDSHVDEVVQHVDSEYERHSCLVS